MSKSPQSIKTLVQGFAKHIRELKAPDYKESQLRKHYLDPFWKLLGWDVDNEEQLAPQEVDVLIEPSTDSAEDDGLRSREPDYVFRANGFSRFIVEAKKPAHDLDTNKSAIFQAKRYAWNMTIPFAILTDFEQFRLYDATYKPILNEPTRGLIRDFSLNFEEYPPKWDELVATFGRDAVANGSLERLRAKVRKVSPTRRLRTVDRMLIDLRGDEPVDRVFLEYLEKHRKHLAREIYRDNKKDFPEAKTLHGAARLTEAVQRLIDRLVFIRVCEDRGISDYGGLRETLDRVSKEGGSLYETLRAEFRELDKAYNGYLFKHHFSEQLNVSSDVLADLIRTLYPPDGPWDFAKIGDDILGIVYERFLGHVVTVKHGQAEIEEKPEVRHAGGVYYTPRFIVDTIIRRVVGPKIAGKSPSQVLDIKILDPACGSGSFLVAAFQYLIDHCASAIAANPALATVPATPKARKKKKEIAFRDKKGRWQLAPDFKAAILTSCIHGVDIDQQAVEVTVMSLYLKMLEGELPPHWQREWLENELLPSLDENILCGNSLINTPDFDQYVSDTYGGLFPLDDDVRFRMNRFDWDSRTRGFGRIIGKEAERERGRSGFDCIIGNPPYIRVQELNKWAPEECEFYKWKYKSAAKGSYDIYMVFTEKAISLLSPDGLLGFIMPHKFWQNRDAAGLRKVIVDGNYLNAVVDFGDQQVFKGATTYTAIHVLNANNRSKILDVARVTALDDGVTQCAAIDAGRPVPGVERFATASPAGADVWRFHDTKTEAFLGAMKSAGECLFPNVCDAVFQGIVTGADPIFLSVEWMPHPTNEKVVRFMSDAENAFVDIEKSITVPVIRRQGFESYSIAAEQLLILPYDRNTESLLPQKDVAANFPFAWAYLKRNQKQLVAREHGRFAETWWCLSRAQNIRKWLGKKVLVPYMIERLQAVADDNGRFFVNVTTGGYGLSLRPKVSAAIGKGATEYIVGLLNSRLLDYAMRRLSNHFHGGYYPASKQYLQHLPIKLPQSPGEKNLADRITESVRNIMDAKGKLRSPKLSDRDKNQLDSEIDSLERRIDELVFRLYGVESLPE